MEYKNYYKVLGVEKSSTQDEIKRAYRKLARKYHPDLNKEKDAEDTFKEISEANEVLSDVEKRAAYDQLGQSHQSGQDFQPPPNWDQGFEFRGETGGNNQHQDFSDFFENLFGEAYKQKAKTQFHAKGEDLHAKVMIDITDSFHGAKRMLGLKVPELTPDGHVTLKERKLDVTIPKGVKDGQHIRLRNQGAPGFSEGLGEGKAGDLYLEIVFNHHPFYHTEGTDLYLKLPVTPWEAALGSKVKISTPEGLVDLTIPANSKQGSKLRLKERGLPAKNPGDLYVILQITLPPADTEKARELYETMAKELDFDPRERLMSEAI
jgi:curved DNA-binding protein